jgi:hypothetical protein
MAWTRTTLPLPFAMRDVQIITGENSVDVTSLGNTIKGKVYPKTMKAEKWIEV